MRYTATFLITLILCFASQSLALRAVGGRTAKSESNYFSSIARIQSGARDAPEITFLGSSITGRLPDRVQGFTGVANMGCDGGSAVDALRAMDQGILPISPVMVIEANTLFKAFDAQETEISKAIRSSWFRVGRRIPALSATARPSAFFYSRLLASKIGTAGGPDGERVTVTTHPAIPAAGIAHIGNPQQGRVLDELSEILGRMRQQGSSCWIVAFPPKMESGSPRYQIGQALAAKAEIPFWDLGSGIPADRIALTDGVHMAPATAAIAVRELLTILKKQGIRCQ